ncbi:GntR family transcriptional regulator [Microbacterium sp. E-13]|uniref:GntR family transcriptional regulator n=1 Tax=Microbacterium sp. E-13 TaxID=3404048 RepID=UPI003CFAD20D
MDERERLIDRIRRVLAEEQYAAGERIGSERALADELGVTRSELRGALEPLEQEGAIRRSMGRTGGVFAWDGKIERQLNAIEGVPAMLRRQGFAAETTVLLAGMTIADPSETRALRLGDGESVFRLRRRRTANGVPLSIDEMTIPTRLVPGIQAHTLTESMYGLLFCEYGIEPEAAEETIDVASADAGQAGSLGIAVGDPLFEIRRITYDRAGAPFEYSRDLFRADRTRITLRRSGPRWKRASGTAG